MLFINYMHQYQYYHYHRQNIKQMKANSPAHRMIQLRRRTQKIVIPKASWDLSNKQNSNNNITNLYETSKSKNHSSKKNSLQKNPKMKKNLSMTQNMLKCTIKKQVKPQAQILNRSKEKQKQKSREKQKSIQKISHPKRIDSKDASLINSFSCFAQGMENVLVKASKRQAIAKIKTNYHKCFANFLAKTQKQKVLLNVFTKHLDYWMSYCEQLQKSLKTAYSNSPKLNIMNIQNIQSQEWHEDRSKHFQQSEQLYSEPSMCSYIVDPQQQIKMKPIRNELKQQLHLNFAKVQQLRKKQFE